MISQSGNGVTSTGLSDIFLNAGFQATKTLKLTAGLKLPLSDGNKSQNGLPLPMDYQSSLGTVDLIEGLNWALGKLQLAAALQQPLTQNNNTFRSEAYPS